MEPYVREDVPEDTLERAVQKRIFASKEREAVLKKFKSLHSSTRNEEEKLQKLFRPVTSAIKARAEQKKTVPVTDAGFQTDEPLKEIDKKKVFDFNAQPSKLITVDKSIVEDGDDGTVLISKKRKRRNSSSFASLKLRVHSQIGHLLRERDLEFGPRYDEVRDLWFIGEFSIKFEKELILLGTDEVFSKTAGLLELLFEKNPENFTELDKLNYVKIIRTTGLHLGRNGRPKHQDFAKYKYIIAPFLQDVPEVKSSPPASGSGIRYVPHPAGQWKRDYGGCPVDYKYYKHPQELVDRALLLLAAREAGHRGHENEILELESELRQIGVLD
jgi:hypothetical protein